MGRSIKPVKNMNVYLMKTVDFGNNIIIYCSGTGARHGSVGDPAHGDH